MINNILVALDGSAPAERGLAIAVALAQRMKGLGAHPRILLARATEPPMLAGAADSVRLRLELLEAAKAYLESLAEPLQAQRVHVDIAAREGPAAEVLLEIIAEQTIDLAIMATHGRTGIAHWVLGSVAEAVAERASAPVLLVPRHGDVAFAPDQTWRILLPLDGSLAAEGILLPAAQIARALGAEVWLLRVLLPVYPYPATLPASQESPDRRRLREAEHYLEERAEQLRRLGLSVRWNLIFGSPAQDITDRAEHDRCHIVILPRRPRTRALPWPGGSVPQRLLRSGQVAVLFVTPSATTAAPAASPAETNQVSQKGER
jgi:nucleotide-binding universal stress UspA family protein